jgi:hypothetical protein
MQDMLPMGLRIKVGATFPLSNLFGSHLLSRFSPSVATLELISTSESIHILLIYLIQHSPIWESQSQGRDTGNKAAIAKSAPEPVLTSTFPSTVAALYLLEESQCISYLIVHVGADVNGCWQVTVRYLQVGMRKRWVAHASSNSRLPGSRAAGCADPGFARERESERVSGEAPRDSWLLCAWVLPFLEGTPNKGGHSI